MLINGSEVECSKESKLKHEIINCNAGKEATMDCKKGKISPILYN
jgi:hypothetical protein